VFAAVTEVENVIRSAVTTASEVNHQTQYQYVTVSVMVQGTLLAALKLLAVFAAVLDVENVRRSVVVTLTVVYHHRKYP
jgi:hypothetical protein